MRAYFAGAISGAGADHEGLAETALSRAMAENASNRMAAARFLAALEAGEAVAGANARRYRWLFLVSSSVAVLTSLFVACATWLHGLHALAPDFELGALALVSAAVFIARRRRWREHWFEARDVVERLRLTPAAWLLATRPIASRARPSNWPEWYARSIFREQPLFSGDLSQHRHGLRDALTALVDDQATHHLRNEARMSAVDRGLEGLGLALLGTIAIVNVVYLWATLANWTAIEEQDAAIFAVSIFLAASATALYAARLFGDYEDLARHAAGSRGVADGGRKSASFAKLETHNPSGGGSAPALRGGRATIIVAHAIAQGRVMAGEATLNLFVSSPGDVQSERERVDFVVERLNAEYKGRVQIRTIRWETRYYSSHETFQSQIPEAAACDLVLAIFGARLGSPLPGTFPAMPSGEPYPSGTAYEVLSAIEARRKGQGVPDIYVFRRPRAPLVALDAADRDDIEAQWRRLTGFFETWFRNRGGEFLAAFQEFTTTDEFALKAEDCLRQWLARRGFPAKSAIWDRARLGSPFPGLAAFDESRQAVFFGRSLVIEQAIRRLREIEASADGRRLAPFLLLIGASGSGKSSLLRAGLLPRIALPGVLPEVDLWRRALTVPGPDPFASLAEALLAPEALAEELSQGPFGNRELLAKQLAGDPEAAAAPVRAALDAAAGQRRRESGFETVRPARLFLAVDQAERLLIETPTEVAARFCRLLEALCRRRVVTLVMTLRSDAYARFQALDALVNLRDSGATLDLLPATTSELEEMAARPAALCEPPLVFEQREGRSLVAELVADARGGDALPLMQMTLARLSEAEAARGDGVLRFADYHGLGEAVTQTANEALAGLADDARGQLPDLIAGLVRDVAADPLTGAQTPVIGAIDRARFEAGRPERRALIDVFVAKRLLTAEGDAASERVRPTHEALLRIWPEAVAIIAETSYLIRTRSALEPIAREWIDAPPDDKARHLDISPALLDGAQRYVERFGGEASAVIRDFVTAASAVAAARRDRERKEQERQLADAKAIAAANRRIARRTGIGLVAALALAGVAGWQWLTADAARKEAQTQRDRAEQTLALATETADTLIFDLAQKFRGVTGMPKQVVMDILERARGLQEQLLKGGQSTPKLKANHAAALAEIAITLLALGDNDRALALVRQSSVIYADIHVADPGNPRYIHDLALTNQTIGDILRRQGDLDEALAAYRQSLATLDAASAKSGDDLLIAGVRPSALEGIGTIETSRGDLPAALGSFREALALCEKFLAGDPKSVPLRNGVAVAQRDVGDVLLKQNDLEGAVAAFNAASDISGSLARENPDDTGLQRDFSISKERLGETLTAKRDFAGALHAFEDGEAMALAMASKDPGNLEWQYDLAIGDVEIGDAKLALGDFDGAAQVYRDAVRIDQGLVTHDATNALWRKHHWDAQTDLADALSKEGKRDLALDAYRDGLAFAQSIVRRTPGDADWRRTVVYAQNRLGDALLGQGDADGALVAYRGGLSGIEALAAQNAKPAEHASDLETSWTKVGAALTIKGDIDGAIAAYREAEIAARASIAADPKNPGRRGQLSALLVSIGHLLARQGGAGAALIAFREGAALAATLGKENPGSELWPQEETLAEEGVAGALRAKGDSAGAIDAYRKSLALDQRLFGLKPGDRELQAGDAYRREQIGDLMQERGDLAGAVTMFRAALNLRQGLAKESPDDRQVKFDEMVDHNRIGNASAALGDTAGALAAFKDGLAIARVLAAGADARGDSRFNLVFSLNSVGWMAMRAGDKDAAAQAFSDALPIVQDVVAKEPDRANYRNELWLVATNLGDARFAQAAWADALAAYVAGRDAAAALVARDKANAGYASALQTSVDKIGYVANAMLIANDPKSALDALDKATPATPRQNWLDLIRAGALMLLDRPDVARALYLKHRGEISFGGKTWEELTKSGLAQMRLRGVYRPLMDEIEQTFTTPPQHSPPSP